MRDGSLKLNFEAGKIVAAFTNARLDSLYEEMFRRARRSVHRNSGKPETGIKVIIFGCFWLEAYCNEVLRFTLQKESKNEKFGAALWEILKRSNAIEKLQLLSVLTDKFQESQYNLLLPKIKKTFALRNRLAHFKDEDVKVAEKITSNEFLEFLSTVDDPDLMKELKGKQAIEYSTTILETQRWLSNMSSHCARRHNIKLSSYKKAYKMPL